MLEFLGEGVNLWKSAVFCENLRFELSVYLSSVTSSTLWDKVQQSAHQLHHSLDWRGRRCNFLFKVPHEVLSRVLLWSEYHLSRKHYCHWITVDTEIETTQIINLCKKWGFHRFQEERLKVCKTALFAHFLRKKVRFCTLLGAPSGIGGNPFLRRLIIWAISALWLALRVIIIEFSLRMIWGFCGPGFRTSWQSSVRPKTLLGCLEKWSRKRRDASPQNTCRAERNPRPRKRPDP